MEGCLGTGNTSQWGNIHQQNLNPNLTRSVPNSMLDPIQHEFQRVQYTNNNSSQGGLMGGLPWDESAPSPSLSLLLMNQQPGPPVINPGPLTHVVQQPQPFDGSNGTTSGSVGRLLSATNSNTDTSNSIEDDGVSMMINQQNMWNFSSSTHCEKVFLSESNNNPRKRSVHIFDDENISQHGGDGFKLIRENINNPLKGSKRAKLTNQICYTSSNNISFQQAGATSSGSSIDEPDPEAIQQMKEMIYRVAAFRPVNFGVEVMDKPKRKNVRVSSDPQTVAARHRRERISERLRVLQKIVPGGSKMDTASMLDEAANYLKFLRNQVTVLEALGNGNQFGFTNNNIVSSANHDPSVNLQFSIPTIDPHATTPPNTTPLFSLQNPS